jgi:uncharacterized protein YjbI with pentapeptide repeats
MASMPPRRSEAPIGTTQPPDILEEELDVIEVDRLEPAFRLEDARIRASSLGGSNAGSGRFERTHLADMDLSESRLRGVQLTDVIAEGIDAANSDWSGAQLRRVRVSDGRLTGLNLAEGRVEEVSFQGCKLDYVNFRHCSIGRVTFQDCVLNGADFQGATIEATRFAGCQLAEADFSKATMSRVDLRGSELALAGSLLGIGGAIIDQLQLLDLAGELARQLGISVEES